MKRSDGELIKGLNPFVQMIPLIMERRSGAQIFGKRVFPTEPIDRYIHDQRALQCRIRYMHIFIAAVVRVMYERPALNRFVMNGSFYQRKGIIISMTLKRSLRDEGEETTIKFEFTGRETIFECAEIIDRSIAEGMARTEKTDEDRLLETIMGLPGPVRKMAALTLKGMDRLNLLPESVIKISPFHSSMFFTHLKSIKTDYIYHHLYDFGTTSFFMALGKNVKLPVVEQDKVVIREVVQVGFTSDERICDGVYLARSLRLLEKYVADPSLLESRPGDSSPVIPD